MFFLHFLFRCSSFGCDRPFSIVLSFCFFLSFLFFFFFQAEDGIRDWSVTGVQTCALPICKPRLPFSKGVQVRAVRISTENRLWPLIYGSWGTVPYAIPWSPCANLACQTEIGRASCRERV